jgi:hypothetical protein
MSAAKFDGGPAFPAHFTNEGERNVMSPDGRVVPPGYAVVMQGMTLRDYFAAKAMQAGICGHFANGAEGGHWSPEEISAFAYEQADAMLKARAQ